MNRFSRKHLNKIPALLFATVLLLIGIPGIEAAEDSVQVERDWTPVPDGEAQSETDVTMKNDELAITITGGDGSTPPWGVPQGGILDGAPVVDGEIQVDQVTLIDFLPDRWSAYPSDYQEIEIIEDTSEKAVVEARRGWYEVDIVTTYTLESENNYVHMETDMINDSEETYENINTGYTFCIEDGWIDVPGGRGPREDTIGDWMVGYNEDWAYGIHTDFHEAIDGGTTWTEQYITQTIEAGETKTFESKIQFEENGDASQIIDLNLELTDAPHGQVSGEVTNVLDETVEEPVVIAYKDDEAIGWTNGENGEYSFDLPEGNYELEAIASETAPSSRKEVTIEDDVDKEVIFDDVEAPGRLDLNITDADTGEPLDARIEMSGGPDYTVRYLGTNTRFTDLENVGRASFNIAPETYDITIKSGANFVSETKVLEDITIESGETIEKDVSVETITDPTEEDWYSADLHQHSDILDGITSPKDLVRSNLASQLDLTFLSDHDSTERHEDVQNYSDKRDIPFIPSIEISPMWAHFNVFPLPIGYDELPEDGKASEIFEAAREVSDDVVIQIAHPWIEYGYYFSKEEDRIPGGYDDDYDVVEWFSDREETIDYISENYWNKGEEKYLVTATDVHDVETTITGAERTYAYVEDELTVDGYSKAVYEGNSFVSYGPLLYPDQQFGEKHEATNGEFELSFTAEAVNGLKEIHIYSEDGVVDSKLVSSEYVALEEPQEKDFSFNFSVDEDTWFAIRVVDESGKEALSNPVWVETESSNENANNEMVNVRTLEADVSWDSSNNEIIVEDNNRTLILEPNSSKAYVNDNEVKLETAPILEDGRTQIPKNIITELLED